MAQDRLLGATALLLVLSVVLVSCGGGQVGEGVRPKDLTAQVALGAVPSCAGDPKLVRPLVIDLDADARVDLEATMKKGVVVVAYDCKSLRVLSNCAVGEGAYEYAGVSRKEQVLQLKNADEVQANLPLSGGKVSGEVKSGRSLDLGLVYIGRKTTLVQKVDRAQLSGTCEGATHYLQNATLGAFSMTTGSAGKVAAIAELFKVGASGSSESTRGAQSSDGSIDACRKADSDAETPPPDCRSPLRVELMPIQGKAPEATASAAPSAEPGASPAPPPPSDSSETASSSSAAPEKNPCMKGFVYADGICTRSTSEAHLCDYADEADCKAQCEKGSVESCFNYGETLEAKRKDPLAKPLDAIAVWTKACEGGHAESCASWGVSLRPLGDAPTEEAQPWIAKSIPPLKKGCEMGSARACAHLASAYGDSRNSSRDLKAGFGTYVRACSLGDALSCTFAAWDYAKGDGVAKNPQKGLDYFAKACASGNPEVCGNFADELATGKVFNKDLPRALGVSQKLCESLERAANEDKSDTMAKIKMSDQCDKTAEIALEAGRYDVALTFANKACAGTKSGCLTLAQLHQSGKGTKKDLPAANAILKEVCKTPKSDELRLHPVCESFLSGKGGAGGTTPPKKRPKKK